MSPLSHALAEDYYHRACGRLKILEHYFDAKLYADVVRESQELVELALKGLLRKFGIDPPRVHDVGPSLIQYQALFPTQLATQLSSIAAISKRLRKEREVSFYGDEDLIPSETYGPEEAREAIDSAGIVLRLLEVVFCP